jgi:hypothetical protein
MVSDPDGAAELEVAAEVAELIAELADPADDVAELAAAEVLPVADPEVAAAELVDDTELDVVLPPPPPELDEQLANTPATGTAAAATPNSFSAVRRESGPPSPGVSLLSGSFIPVPPWRCHRGTSPGARDQFVATRSARYQKTL